MGSEYSVPSSPLPSCHYYYFVPSSGRSFLLARDNRCKNSAAKRRKKKRQTKKKAPAKVAAHCNILEANSFPKRESARAKTPHTHTEPDSINFIRNVDEIVKVADNSSQCTLIHFPFFPFLFPFTVPGFSRIKMLAIFAHAKSST